MECLVSGFYPQDVQVHWLRDGVHQQQVESEPQKLPNGTFYIRSMIRPEEKDLGVSYVCHVQHKAWDKPLEMKAHWQLEDEGEGVLCPTPQQPQSSGTEGTPRSYSPTPVPTSPTSATGTVAVWTWIVFGLGLMLCATGVILLYMVSKKGELVFSARVWRKDEARLRVRGLRIPMLTSSPSLFVGKNKSYPETKSKGPLNRESAECMMKSENDCGSGSTTPL